MKDALGEKIKLLQPPKTCGSGWDWRRRRHWVLARTRKLLLVFTLKYNVLHLKCGLNMYIISYFTGQVTKFLGSQNSVSVNFPLGTGHADQALPNQHKVKTLARDTLHFISRGKPWTFSLFLKQRCVCKICATYLVIPPFRPWRPAWGCRRCWRRRRPRRPTPAAPPSCGSLSPSATCAPSCSDSAQLENLKKEKWKFLSF